MSYLQELDALGRWIKGASNLNSRRISDAPSKVGRPFILWEAPSRRRDRNLTRYQYTVPVRQYGKLFVQSLDMLADYQDKLLLDIEEKQGILPVFDNETAQGVQIAILKNVAIEFHTSETLDIPFNVSYEATYGRTQPVPPPPATYVGNRVVTEIRGQ